ncbi:EF-P 5-aminopentanol modification-associated protein YfmF [Cytobacillus kochii]|uniref:Peptidase M16 n=1 Tax=Cytobacillus kochii TaxID=859143 RepID=A0A248TCK5_9BACI|nr:pitrilysin family protein [Cytobacillus kochii]ASV65893.1 peptidase M16 [Cytobacillus kochii]
MNITTETVKEIDGVKLHQIKTDKYKTNTIVWKMKAPLSKDTVTLRALLPHVLESSSAAYPTTAKLRAYLDELYGASLYVDLSKKGEYHIISMTIEMANEKFLSDQTPLLRKAFELLSELLLHPLSNNGAFDREVVESEKRTLKQRIQAVNDDKMRYANLRLVQEMCKDEAYALHVHGELDDLPLITESSLYHYYEKALAEDELDLYMIGDIDTNEVEQYVRELLPLKTRSIKETSMARANDLIEPETIKEEQDVKQAKLNIGYRTGITYGDPEYSALQIFNGIFGGFSHSKLFINVREKASLAYYVASRLESHKGLLMVMSGIDNNSYGQATSIIEEQLEEMQKGAFTEEEITQTKAVIKNQMLETMDAARGVAEVLYHNIVSRQKMDLTEWMNGMEAVTKEDIITVAKKVQLDTIYFLHGKEVQK